MTCSTCEPVRADLTWCFVDRLSQWVVRLSQRAHPNVARVALANKTARLAWALLRHHRDYQPALAAA